MKHAGGRSLRGGRSKHQEQCGCCCMPPSPVLPYLAYHQLGWGLHQQVGSSQPARNKRFNACNGGKGRAQLSMRDKVQVLRLNAQPHAAKPSAHTTASTHLQSACSTARRDPGAAGTV